MYSVMTYMGKESKKKKCGQIYTYISDHSAALCSSDSTQYSVMAYVGKECKNEWIYVYMQRRGPRFDLWVEKIPWRRKWLLTPVFWPGEFHGVYSPCGCKESDMTE